MSLGAAIVGGVGVLIGAVVTAIVLLRPLRRRTSALTEMERRYRTLFETAPMAIWEQDFRGVRESFARLREQGVSDLRAWFAAHPEAVFEAILGLRVVDVNDATVRMWEASSKSELIERLPRLFCEASPAVLADELVTVWKEQPFFAGVIRAVSCRGNRLDLLMTWSALERGGRLDLTRVLGAFIDIGDLIRTRADLSAERERLAVTLESISEAVVSVGTDGRILSLNPAAARLFGCDVFEALRKPFLEVAPLRLQPPGPDPVEAVLGGASATEVTRGCLLVLPDGREREVELVIAPMTGRDARRQGAVLVVRDVTERRQIERETINASKLESIALLAGGLAHDFNNMLTVMTNGIYLLHVGGVMPEADEALKEMERSVARAREITRQLLVFTRGGGPVKELSEFAPVVREAACFAVVGSNVCVEFDFLESLWSVEIDRAQVAQAVQNIVLNARQAMPGGGRVRIVARNDPEGPGGTVPASPFVRLSVRDEGPGIRPEDAPRIFEPFFTTKPNAVGIGLPAARSVVQRHGGVLEHRPQSGPGAEFVLWLPASSGQVRARPASVGAPAAGVGRILFVDDEEPVRVLAARVLETIGYSVAMAGSGESAVLLYRKALEEGTPFDVVITDLTMRGGMDGVETLKALRAVDERARVIVSSGYCDDPVMSEHGRHGFDGVIEKPYEVARLAMVVRDVLRR